MAGSPLRPPARGGQRRPRRRRGGLEGGARGPGVGGVLLHRLRRGLPLAGGAQRPGGIGPPGGGPGGAGAPGGQPAGEGQGTAAGGPAGAPVARCRAPGCCWWPGAPCPPAPAGSWAPSPSANGASRAGCSRWAPWRRRRPPPGWRASPRRLGLRLEAGRGRRASPPAWAATPGSCAGPWRSWTCSADGRDREPGPGGPGHLPPGGAERCSPGPRPGRAARSPRPCRPCAWPWRTTPPAAAPLMLLGQARREVERLCRLAEARRQGVKGGPELVAALGLSPRQAFLLDGYHPGPGPDRPRGGPAPAGPGEPDRPGPQGPGHLAQRHPAAQPHHGAVPGLGQLRIRRI